MLEALDLRPGMTFLNVGSGSGYLSCIAASLLGQHGVSHGVEISQPAVDFSKEAIVRWRERLLSSAKDAAVKEDIARQAASIAARATAFPVEQSEAVVVEHASSLCGGLVGCCLPTAIGSSSNPSIATAPSLSPPTAVVPLSVSLTATAKAEIDVVCGNCFDLDLVSASQTLRYDRVYVGAGVPPHRRTFFMHLLAEGGVLVMPVDGDNELVQVRRVVGGVYTNRAISSVHFAPLIESDYTAEEVVEREREGESDGEGETAMDEERVLQRLLQRAVDSSSLSLSRSVDDEERDTVRVSVRVLRSTPPSLSRHRLRLPALLWAPQRERHSQFPQCFRDVVRLILLAAHRSGGYMSPSMSKRVTGNKRKPMSLSLCGLLPVHLWYHVFSFASR